MAVLFYEKFNQITKAVYILDIYKFLKPVVYHQSVYFTIILSDNIYGKYLPYYLH